jgi:hypothetical protein
MVLVEINGSALRNNMLSLLEMEVFEECNAPDLFSIAEKIEK